MPHHDPPQLFLVDGYALIYRAFFAMISRPLTTSKGINTSVAWGIVNFLLRLRDKYQPDYIAWVNDAGDSFRTETYAEYKSTREKLDAELQADFDQSLEHVSALLEAFRLPQIEVPGYEADDVIGTLATRAAEAGYQAAIVSGDKDFYQLIDDHIALLNPGRGGPAAVTEQWVDSANAQERLGVPPRQVVDYLALVGDSSDNVPGVKGIGPKGAVALLTEYGDLESIIAQAPSIKQKRPREALAAHADNARLSRELVTLKRDLPVDVEVTDLAAQEPDTEALGALLSEFEFYSLAERLDLDATHQPNRDTVVDLEETGRRVVVVDDPADLSHLVDTLRAGGPVALSVQASSRTVRSASLTGVGLALSGGEIWYLPFDHRNSVGALAAPTPVSNLPPLSDPVCGPLADLLSDAAVPKLGHDMKFGWEILRGAGVEFAGVAYDTMLESFVLDPGRRSHTLDNVSLDQIGAQLRPWHDVVGKGKAQVDFAETAVADAAEYAGRRAAAALALHQTFAPELERLSLTMLLNEIEMPLIEVLVDMEWAGIAIDQALFAQLSQRYSRELEALKTQTYQAAGQEFNLNSPKQLAVVLFEQGQLPVLKKTKTGPSTDADVLDQLSAMGYEVPQLILAYRELQKLLSTYVDVLPQAVNPLTSRIHTTYHQTGAATGRLSSSDPNLQNIPVRTDRGGEIRRAFVAGPGHRFVVADYSQIELRLMAHLSGDELLVQAFEQGGDIHRQTAAVTFDVSVDEVTAEMRAQAKTINFATIYGQGPFALGKQLGISNADAKEFIAQYFERFAGVRAYLDLQVDLARKQGYVETLFGRRRYITEIKSKNFNVRSFGERTAQNTPLQGSAADLIKIAMRNIHQQLADEGLATRLILQVHDELVLEAPEAEVDRVSVLVRDAMESAADLRVPLLADVGVGLNWLDAKA
jgi:DNA polymerase-1